MTVGENIRRIRKERDAISKRRLQNMGQEDKYYIKNHHPAIVSEDIFDKALEIGRIDLALLEVGQYVYLAESGTTADIINKFCGYWSEA